MLIPLIGLMKPWDDQPPSHLLPGVALPKLNSDPFHPPSDPIPYSLLGLPTASTSNGIYPSRHRNRRGRQLIQPASRDTWKDRIDSLSSVATLDGAPDAKPAPNIEKQLQNRGRRIPHGGTLASRSVPPRHRLRFIQSDEDYIPLGTREINQILSSLTLSPVADTTIEQRRRTQSTLDTSDNPTLVDTPTADPTSGEPESRMPTAPEPEGAVQTPTIKPIIKAFEIPLSKRRSRRRTINVSPWGDSLDDVFDTAALSPSTIAWQISAMEEALDEVARSPPLDIPRSTDEESWQMLRRLASQERMLRRRRSPLNGATRSETIDKLKKTRRARSLPMFVQGQRPVASTFVRRQLLRESPPPSQAILNHLRLRPELMTAENLEILTRYAERANALTTASEATHLLGSVGTWSTRHRTRARRHLAKRSYSSIFLQAVDRWQRKRLRMAPETPLEPEDALKAVESEFARRQADPEGIDYPERIHGPFWFLSPHPWAEAVAPICNELPAKPTVDELLGRLHFLLAMADFRKTSFTGLRPSADIGLTDDLLRPNDNTSLVRKSDTWFSQPDYHSPLLSSLHAIAEACHAAGRRQQGSRQAMLLVLHLYMIYANRLKVYREPPTVTVGCRTILYQQLSRPYLGVWMLEEYARLYTLPRPSRQTLHLLFQEILFGRPMRSPLVSVASLPPPGFTRDMQGLQLYQLPPQPDPQDAPRLISDVHIILKTFQQRWSISPGPETIRMLSSYALQVNAAGLGKECWDMWWEEMSRNVAREPRWEGDYPRWDHRKKHTNSWVEVLKSMESRGWVKVADEADLEFKPSINHTQSVISRCLAKMAGKENMAHERRKLKRRLARASAKGESEHHPDIRRGEVGGAIWFGFANQTERWRWVGKGHLSLNVPATSGKGTKFSSPKRGVGLELSLVGSAFQDVTQSNRV